MIEPSGRLAKVPAMGVAAVLLMTVKVVPTRGWPRIIQATFKVALLVIVTTFPMSSAAQREEPE